MPNKSSLQATECVIVAMAVPDLYTLFTFIIQVNLGRRGGRV